MNAAFQQLLGITITVLECLFVSPFPAIGQHGNSIFAMSNHDSVWIVPQEGEWISFALGCHDWRLETLAESIVPFFAELPSLLHGSWHPLTEEELASLQRAIPRLKNLCTELAKLGIPASLHHGDFHRVNIMVNETSCTLLDWAGFVGVAHPFFSLWVPLSDWDQLSSKQLCDSYLAIWHDFAPIEPLRSAVALAHPLGALCGALGHRHQLKHIHSQLPWDILNEQENMLECLRSVLDLLHQKE